MTHDLVGSLGTLILHIFTRIPNVNAKIEFPNIAGIKFPSSNVLLKLLGRKRAKTNSANKEKDLLRRRSRPVQSSRSNVIGNHLLLVVGEFREDAGFAFLP